MMKPGVAVAIIDVASIGKHRVQTHIIPEYPLDPDEVEGDILRIRLNAEACREMPNGKIAMQQILGE
jgi:hypothetical protein